MTPAEQMPAEQDRLTTLGDLLRPCPPPGPASGTGQCAHGTWPCVITRAAWLAQGRDPGPQAPPGRTGRTPHP